MQLFSSTSRNTALCFLSSAWLLACGSTPTTTPTESSVDSAYAALVGDIANCAKEVKTCVDGAGSDATALGACRTQFDDCRQSAGKDAENKLADAVRACTSTHNTCVRGADKGEAGSCRDDLNMCLRAAHPKSDDDADAGSDEDKGDKGEHRDCLDDLHTCVQAADGSAQTCAQSVCKCVRDSLPDAKSVVPSDDDADDDRGRDEGGKGGKPGDVGKPISAGRMCVDALMSCIESGSDPRSCAQGLRDCSQPAQP